MNTTIDELYPFLKRWTCPGSYMGATWEDYFGSGFGQNRDSDTLARSNFAVVRRELAKLPEWEPPSTEEDDEEPISRQVIREGHWACGWVEWIAIHESDTAALALCNELKDSEGSYPVLDESHWSELENDEAQDTWRDGYDNKERVKYMRENASQFEFRSFADMLGCARGSYFCGHAGELLQ